MKILLIEDEIMLAEAVAHVLRKNNYSVDMAHDGVYGLDCALTDTYDVIILDIMLPQKDGISVLRELRREGIKSRVIMLTAKSQTEDKITGLDAGADDYLSKPFQVPELLARLRALLRRKGELHDKGMLRYKNILFDPHTLLVRKDSITVKLTLKESQILEMLIALMAVISYKAQETRLENILLIVPGRPAQEPVDIGKLEDRNGSGYFLTYEVNRAGVISALNKNTKVIVTETNGFYADVMQKPLIAGAFFTKTAQDEGKKLAVLNRKAAFKILGDMQAIGNDIKIDGERFTVCGVMADGDKTNSKVYVPFQVGQEFSTQAEQGFSAPGTFMASIGQGGLLAEEDVKSRMRKLAANGTDYEFYLLGDFIQAIHTKTFFSIKCAALAALFCCWVWGAARLRRRMKRLRTLHERYDFAELWREGQRDIVCGLLDAAVLAAAFALAAALIIRGVRDMLFLADMKITIDTSYQTGFFHPVSRINKLSVYAHFAFWGYIGILSALCALYILTRHKASMLADMIKTDEF